MLFQEKQPPRSSLKEQVLKNQIWVCKRGKMHHQVKYQKAILILHKSTYRKGDKGTSRRVVTMYLDFAELQASRQIQMKMADWITRLDAFLQFNEYQILKDPGKVSHEVAVKLAEKEYDKFRVIQDRNFVSDFDEEIKKISKPTKE